MKKRACQWQSVMLETKLRVLISRCENRTSNYYLGPINEEICASCSQRNPVGDNDVLADSMVEEVYGVKVNEKSDQILADLANAYCADCPPQQDVK